MATGTCRCCCRKRLDAPGRAVKPGRLVVLRLAGEAASVQAGLKVIMPESGSMQTMWFSTHVTPGAFSANACGSCAGL